MVNRPGDEAVRNFRSSSVMLDEAEEVYPRMDNAAGISGHGADLPENVRAALEKAKEVVEAKRSSPRDIELLKALVQKDILKANRIAQYFEKNPKNNPIQMTLSVLFNYFSNLLICYYSKDRSEAGLMTTLGLRGNYQVKDYLLGMRNHSAMKVFNLIGEIRLADARSKGVDNTSASDADILKELLYKILH